MGDAVTALDVLQVAVGVTALALLPPGVAYAVRECLRALYAMPARERHVALAAMVLGALIRAWVPKRIVTVFLGYAATQSAVDVVPVPRYGAGTTLVHAAWLALFGDDHRVILLGNSVTGALSLVLWAAVFRRWVGAPWAAVVCAWVLVLTPMFVRNDTSDSNNVVALALTAVALLAHAHTEREPAWKRALAVVPAATLAATARPDFVVFVPVAFALQGALTSWWRVWAVAVLPHVVHVVRSAVELQGRASLPVARSVLRAPMELLADGAPWSPRHFPIALTVIAAWVALRGDPSARTTARRLWAGALLAMLPTCVDLAPANAARVHVPATLLLVPAMALGALEAWRRVGRVARVLAVVAVIAAALPGAWALFRPINDDHEEALLRASIERLPRGRFTLVRLGHVDRYPEFDRGLFVHYEFPDYLLTGDGRDGRASAVGPFLASPELREPVYFFHGVRCHARGRDESAPPPRGEQLHPACEAMHRRFVLEPVIERVAPNEGDHAFAWYPDVARFRLGLHRVVRER